ncbi:nickel-dependent lactate racemase family protein [Cloacibacillus evryensis]
MKNMSAEYNLTEAEGGLEYTDRVEGITVRLPRELERADFIYPEEPQAPDFDTLMKGAMANPIGAPLLRETAKGKRNAAVLVSDATRAVATAQVLPFIVRELNEAGISLEDIRLIVATGVHRNATEAEMKVIAGDYYGKIRIENHDPYTPEKLVTLGKTSFGNYAEVNRSAYEAELRVAVGKIEAHEFAGFSGGRKSVLPGIASEKCIVYNHRPEMILNPSAVSGVLKDNPVHLDMLETARLLGIDFCVNMVQNAQGQPLGIFAGEMEAAHLKGIEFLRLIFGMKLSHSANIYLVTPGAPLNIDLYQSIKALVALTPVVKENDTIIFYSKCTEGINSEDMMAPFKGAPSLEAVMKTVTENYRIQMDHALLLCKLYQKGAGIIACSSNIEPGAFADLRMTTAESVDQAIKTAIKRREAGAVKPALAIIPTPQRLVLGNR